MSERRDYPPLSCAQCAHGEGLTFEFSMAFQPIVDIRAKQIFAYEALVRGINNESAGSILSQVTDDNRYRFDQSCRVKAVKWAAQLGMDTRLSINFLPNAIYRPERCIRTTLEAAQRYGFPAENIIFEVTEGEKVEDHEHLINIFREYKRLGFMTALDDFGAGYSGLNLLAEFQPDLLKLDMALIRNLHSNRPRQAIVRGIAQVAHELNITVIAEGIESAEELLMLESLGIHLIQGYYLARPGFQQLPTPRFPG